MSDYHPDTNAEALELLEEYRQRLHFALDATVWAQAMLTVGGEATWDACKSVADSAGGLKPLARRVQTLRRDDVFSQVIP